MILFSLISDILYLPFVNL